MMSMCQVHSNKIFCDSQPIRVTPTLGVILYFMKKKNGEAIWTKIVEWIPSV